LMCLKKLLRNSTSFQAELSPVRSGRVAPVQALSGTLTSVRAKPIALAKIGRSLAIRWESRRRKRPQAIRHRSPLPRPATSANGSRQGIAGQNPYYVAGLWRSDEPPALFRAIIWAGFPRANLPPVPRRRNSGEARFSE